MMQQAAIIVYKRRQWMQTPKVCQTGNLDGPGLRIMSLAGQKWCDLLKKLTVFITGKRCTACISK